MAVQTPGTDPLYAWDVPGWTIQKGGSAATAGLNLESSPGPGAGFGGSQATINGFLGQTADQSVVATTTGTLVTDKFYGGLVYLPEGGQTTKLVVNESAVGTTTHAYGVLATATPGSLTGTVVALTADKTSSALDTLAGVAWASPSATVTLAPGYYYAGVIFSLSATTNVGGLTAAQTAVAMLNTAASLPRFVTSVTLSGAAITVGGSLTYVAQAALGGVYAAFF